jgi:hypothetical protein
MDVVPSDNFGNSPSPMPPDWYIDPWDQTKLRYWDGYKWTEHTKPTALPAGGAPQLMQQAPRHESRYPVAVKKSRGSAFWIFVLLTPILLLAGSGVVYGVLSKQTVSEQEKEAVAGVLLKESDLSELQYSVEPQEPTTREEEAFEKNIDSCYTDGNPSEMYEIDGDGFVFENLSGMRISSSATIYKSSSDATKELLSIEDESYVNCSKGFARELMGSLFEKYDETLSILEMEPYDESVSGVVSRSMYMYVESSSGSGVIQYVTVMQKDAVLVSAVATLSGTNAEIRQQVEQQTGFLEQVNSVIADRLRLAVLETK